MSTPEIVLPPQLLPEEAEMLSRLTPEEREVLQAILLGNEELLTAIYDQEYEESPVDAKTFFTDPYYLGATGGDLYPQVLEDLCEIFNPERNYLEVILGGSIGWGKSTEVEFGLLRCLYEIACLRNPQRSFGLMEGSSIVIINLSVTEQQARKAIFSGVLAKVRQSPFFRNNFAYDPTVVSELRFPKGITVFPGASTDNSILGLNVVAGAVDECLPAEALLRLGNGVSVPVGPLVGKQVSVTTFDFQGGSILSAPAFVELSTVQEVFHLGLSTGGVLRLSGNHPAAVLRDGRLDFKEIRDILDGDVIFAFKDWGHASLGRSQAENVGSCEEACGVAPLGRNQSEDSCIQFGAKTVPGDMRADTCGEAGKTAYAQTPGDVRSGQSLFREISVPGAQGQVASGHFRTKGNPGDTGQAVGFTEGEADAHACIQAGVGGAKPDTGVPAFRRDQGQNFGKQCVEAAQSGLSVSVLCDHREGRGGGSSQSLGSSCCGDFGQKLGRGSFRERSGTHSISSRRWYPSYHSRLLGAVLGWLYGLHRSEATGLYEPPQGSAQERSRRAVLQGARVGLSGLDGETTLARVVSKKNMGLQPTYKVCVPGYEVFVADGAVVHNTNFMPIVEVRKSVGAKSAGVYDKAASLYNAMIRRMKSRFLRHGRLPGKMFSLSSAQYPNDFIERKVRQALSDMTIFARRYALWDVKREQFSTQTFQVEVGTDLSGSRVLYPGDNPTGKVIEVPVDFRPDFEKDCDGSLRDIAGISTLTVDQFIKDFEKVVACVNEQRHHAFTKETTTLEDGAKLRLGTLLKENPQNPRWKPVLINNPESLRVVHIDPSLSRDATGIAVGHISDMVRVVRRQEDGTEKVEWAPFILYDLLLRVVPPRHREIQYDRIRDIIYRLQEIGMRIGFVSMDSFQTAEMRQQLTRRRIPNDILSVDRTTEPYEILKAAFYEKRIDLYPYPIVTKELRQLEHDRLKGKIDHPEHGSKDVSDAMAGVAYILTLHAARFYKPKVSVSTFG